uniref:Uncharacterized protein n=1 Tax=Cannabis sativa TaxID=3483 RepID=A0A803PLU7_CANSA
MKKTSPTEITAPTKTGENMHQRRSLSGRCLRLQLGNVYQRRGHGIVAIPNEASCVVACEARESPSSSEGKTENHHRLQKEELCTTVAWEWNPRTCRRRPQG